MKRLFRRLAGILTLAFGFVLTLGLCSCLSSAHYSVTAEGTLYSKLSQTVEVVLEEGTFKSSISASNITLSEDLKGKTVTEVKYVDEKKIEVTLDGTLSNLTEESGDYSYYTFEIKGGMKSATATVIVTTYLHAPRLERMSYLMPWGTETIMCSATYMLPYGSFNKDAVSGITLNGEGTLEATIDEDGCLSLDVDDYVPTDALPYPTVNVPANVTSFNKALTITVAKDAYVSLA